MSFCLLNLFQNRVYDMNHQTDTHIAHIIADEIVSGSLINSRKKKKKKTADANYKLQQQLLLLLLLLLLLAATATVRLKSVMI